MADKTDLEKIITDGVDFKNRRIYFGNLSDADESSSFCWGTVERAIRALHKLAENSKKPIELHMSSGGGDTYEMLRLYDAIQECPCQVKFFGSGTIASSATWIMAGCDERYLSKNATIMIHKGSGGVSGDDSEVDIQIDAKQNRQLVQKLNRIYADNSRMPEEFWDEVSKRDLFLTAEETIMLGLADKVIDYKKRGNLRRSRISSLNKQLDNREMKKLIKSIGERIHQGKTLKIELHVPKERFDKEIYVDNSEFIEPLAKEAEETPEEESPQQED